jgi:hypothetical protein
VALASLMAATLLLSLFASTIVVNGNQFFYSKDIPVPSAPSSQPAQKVPPSNSVAQAVTQQDIMVNVCVSFTRGMGFIEFWHMCPFPVYVGFCMAQANDYQFTCDSALRHGTVQITYLPITSRAKVPVSGTDVVFKACAEPRVPRINRPVGTFGPPAIWSCN